MRKSLLRTLAYVYVAVALAPSSGNANSSAMSNSLLNVVTAYLFTVVVT
jgi:hypothetical protein